VTEPIGPHAISVEGSDELTSESSEVARIWVTNNAGSTTWINASILEDPKVFGYLMADTIRNAAGAYATDWKVDEKVALLAIVDGIAEELRSEFAKAINARKGGLH
jgi:hypothetical protein